VSARASIVLLGLLLAAWPAGAAPMAADPSAVASVEDLLRWAADPGSDAIRRDAFAARAAQRLREQVQEALGKGSTDPADVLERLKLELKLAETEALLRGGPSATRVLALQGLPRDARRLADRTDEPLKRLRALAREIDGKLVVWRGDYKLLVTAVPALEDLQAAVAYKTAWVTMYRALAEPPGAERDALLAEAETLAQPFTQSDAAAASDRSRAAALLLVGIVRRERGRHSEAAEALQAAAGDPQLAAEARFQLARNLIEHGGHLAQAGQTEAAQQQWDQARQAIDAYAAQAGKSGNRIGEDLQTALLKHALHQAQAAAATSDQVRRDQARQAQAALAEFAVAHPQAAADADFLAVVAEDYRDAADHQGLNPVVLLALAAAPGEAASPEDANRAAMLDRVIAGGDEVSAAVRPAALWYLATLEASRGNGRRAAELFSQLARESAESAFARPAALNAVICYSNLLNAQTQPVEAPVRKDFIAALELLLGRWGDQADVVGWHFDLGWQYEKLAEQASELADAALLDKALAAYQAVPAGDPRYLQARRRGLGIQAARLLEGPADDPARSQRAERLVEALGDLSTRAGAATQPSSSQPAAPEALEAGAWAEFTAAKVLLDVLDRRDQAMALLAELPQHWPGAAVLAQGLALQAAKLLEGGKVEQAVAAVEALGQDHPAQALVLARRLLGDMAEHGASTQPAGPWTNGRVRLAEYCYRCCDAGDPAEKVAFGLLYGQALLDAGRAAEALEVLLACRAAAEKEAAGRSQQIDSDLSAHLAAVDAAGSDTKALRAMVGELLGQLDAAKLTDSRAAFSLRDALAGLDAPAAPQQQAAEQLASALRESYRQLAQARRQGLAARGDILMALARAYAELTRYEEAAALYGQLAEGLDPAAQNQKEAYWQSELGYCRCILAWRRDDERAMKSLVVRIAQLRVKDPQLGGLGAGFAAIESQAGGEGSPTGVRASGEGTAGPISGQNTQPGR
jgi:hypothetical protein